MKTNIIRFLAIVSLVAALAACQKKPAVPTIVLTEVGHREAICGC